MEWNDNYFEAFCPPSIHVNLKEKTSTRPDRKINHLLVGFIVKKRSTSWKSKPLSVTNNCVGSRTAAVVNVGNVGAAFIAHVARRDRSRTDAFICNLKGPKITRGLKKSAYDFDSSRKIRLPNLGQNTSF